MAARRPELRLGERERSRRDIAGALVAERTVPPQKAFNRQNSVVLFIFFGLSWETSRKHEKVQESTTK